MFNWIKDFLAFRKEQEKRRIRCKRFMLVQAMIKYFEDLQMTKGTVELPPQIEAINAVNSLGSDKNISKMYDRFKVAGLV
jgi:hypothetical protein